MEADRHTLPTSRCWTAVEEPDLTYVSPQRWLYQAGWRVGRDMGDAQGFRRGYVYGYQAGEHQARLSDDSFLEAVARRVRRLELIQDGVAATVAGTVSAIAAHAYRKAGDRNE